MYKMLNLVFKFENQSFHQDTLTKTYMGQAVPVGLTLLRES